MIVLGESPAGMMHTPGPWRVSSESPRIITKDDRAIGSDAGFLIASTMGNDNSGFYASEQEADANARLIAAAPRMLEVLEWLYDEYCCRDDSCGVLFTEQDFRRVHAVIREARAK